MYKTYVGLYNEAAKLNGFKDAAKMKVRLLLLILIEMFGDLLDQG